MREKIVLSKRLEAVASLSSKGNRVCDVGCDHGFIPIYLLQNGIAPKALAMDVKEGPLQQAREHIAACGLNEYIELRRSDGLCNYQIGEADTLICAGMGGRLMMRILEEGAKKAASFKELILQPQSDIEQFRVFLRRQDYLLLDENMIEEDGKFYPMMKVAPAKTMTYGESFAEVSDIKDTDWMQRMEDKYGALLLQRKHPVLYRYLEREKRICGEILGELRSQETDEAGQEKRYGQETGGVRREKRYREVKEQMQDCERVMELFT